MKLKNGIKYEKNGWVYIDIRGSPKERGFAYGYLCASEFKSIQKMLEFVIFESYGVTWEFMISEINKSLASKIKAKYSEFYEEMKGISDGCNSGGTVTTIDEIIAWNFYMSIPYWITSLKINGAVLNISKEGGTKDKCSAFIAVGDYTKTGGIVVAHNSFCEFIDGQYLNVILVVTPSKGHKIIMQTSACSIWSGTDFFVTSAGILGTETTIGGFSQYENNMPLFCRIRYAMQYGNTMDDYVKILIEDNSGDYANSWLFGDVNSNEILRIELGLKYNNVERTKNGFFIGFNAAYDPRIRVLECHNDGFYDTRRHQGARKVRLDDLMDEYKGKLDIEVAKIIIADHYDVYLKKTNPCSRSICSHYELDAREYMSAPDRPKPYEPRGAVDGVVCDTNMAKNMSFSGRFGSSCGTPFMVDLFCDEHRQWKNFKPYLRNRVSQDWTVFTPIANKSKQHTLKKYNKSSVNKTKKSK